MRQFKMKRLFRGQFDGIARLFNLFLERNDWPQDSTYDRIVSFRDRLVAGDYEFTENEKCFIPIIGLMVLSYSQAIIEDTTDKISKQALIDDLLGFEEFLDIYSQTEQSISMKF